MDSRVVISRSRILFSGLLLAALCACSSSPEVKDEKLATLPIEDRQALADEQRAVDVAQTNVEGARAAVREAEQFRSIVGNEQNAAEQQQKAADKAVELEGQAPDQPGAEAAGRRQRVASENRQALEVKDEYARRLVMLRKEELDLREAAVARAKLRLERAQYEALQARGLAKDVDRQAFEEAERAAEREYADQQREVSQAEGYAEAARSIWNEALRSAEATENRMQPEESIGSPQKPEPQPQPAVKELPAQPKTPIEETEQPE